MRRPPRCTTHTRWLFAECVTHNYFPAQSSSVFFLRPRRSAFVYKTQCQCIFRKLQPSVWPLIERAPDASLPAKIRLRSTTDCNLIYSIWRFLYSRAMLCVEQAKVYINAFWLTKDSGSQHFLHVYDPFMAQGPTRLPDVRSFNKNLKERQESF